MFVVSLEETAVKKSMSGEQLHHEVCPLHTELQRSRLATRLAAEEM
jgi:hypothetical protein